MDLRTFPPIRICSLLASLASFSWFIGMVILRGEGEKPRAMVITEETVTKVKLTLPS